MTKGVATKEVLETKSNKTEQNVGFVIYGMQV